MLVHFFFVLLAAPSPAISTLSLHDALPISDRLGAVALQPEVVAHLAAQAIRASYMEHGACFAAEGVDTRPVDRKSTRLNSSHLVISYAVFCLKKKKAMNEYYVTSRDCDYSS